MSDTAAFVIRSFSFLFPLSSVLSILQILSSPLDFQKISEFREADSVSSSLPGTLGEPISDLCNGRKQDRIYSL